MLQAHANAYAAANGAAPPVVRNFGEVQRTPTFVVENSQQREMLDHFQRREQQLNEEYKINKPLCFQGRAYQKTHPVKARKGRTDADATLISTMMLGVADGVSQIEDFGIDPSLLPRELLDAAYELAEEQLFSEPGRHNDQYCGPIPLMRQAFENTESLGSTTVLLSILDNTTMIHGKIHPMMATIAIGDCELLILRRVNGWRGELQAVFHTEMQRIDGNAQAPLQVARVDERVDVNFDERISIDVIERGSAVHCLSAYEGDICIQGSDGLFDNLFLDELIDICNEYMAPMSTNAFTPQDPEVLEEIARRVVQECHNKTKPDANGMPRDCPIGKGGKVDDTCCVVGEVIAYIEEPTTREIEPPKMTLKSLFYTLSAGLFRCDGTGEDDNEVSECDSGSDVEHNCGAGLIFDCKSAVPRRSRHLEHEFEVRPRGWIR